MNVDSYADKTSLSRTFICVYACVCVYVCVCRRQGRRIPNSRVQQFLCFPVLAQQKTDIINTYVCVCECVCVRDCEESAAGQTKEPRREEHAEHFLCSCFCFCFWFFFLFFCLSLCCRDAVVACPPTLVAWVIKVSAWSCR